MPKSHPEEYMRAETMPLDFNNVEQLLLAEPDCLSCQAGTSTCAAVAFVELSGRSTEAPGNPPKLTHCSLFPAVLGYPCASILARATIKTPDLACIPLASWIQPPCAYPKMRGHSKTSLKTCQRCIPRDCTRSHSALPPLVPVLLRNLRCTTWGVNLHGRKLIQQRTATTGRKAPPLLVCLPAKKFVAAEGHTGHGTTMEQRSLLLAATNPGGKAKSSRPCCTQLRHE